MNARHTQRTLALLGALLIGLAGWRAPVNALELPVTCDGDGPSARCTLTVNDSLAFEAGYNRTQEFVDSGATIVQMTGDVTLRTPVQELVLVESELNFTRTEIDGEPTIEVFGVARPPIGELPIVGEHLKVAPMAAVGMVGRENLRLLLDSEENPLPLAENPELPDPTYLFFHFETGIELDLMLAELLGLNTDEGAHDPFQYGFPGDVSLTMILDPADPYFYISTDARELATDGLKKVVEAAKRKKEAARKKAEKKERKAAQRRERERARARKKGSENGTGEDAGSDSDKKKTKKKSDSGKNKKKGKKKKESGGISLGSFAFSGHGGIPFEPATTWGLPDDTGAFHGHLFVDTEIPLGYGVSIEGPVVTYLGENGLEMGGNGEVKIGTQLLGDFVGLSFPLGEASAGLRVSGNAASIYFSGLLDPDTSFLPPQVPVVPAATVRLAGLVDSERPEETRLVAEGHFDIGIGALGNLIGVKLGKALEMDGELRIDRDGFWLQGTTTSRIHRDLAFSGEILVEAYFSPVDLTNSYVILRGDLAVGRVNLSAASEVRLDATGLFVSGAFLTPINTITLLGSVTRTGPAIEGHATVNFATDGVNDALDGAEAEVRKARQEVERIDSEIARMRGVVQAERDRDTAKLREAQAAVSAAQGAVNSIQSSINAKNARIRKLRSEISSWRSWYKKKKWYEKAAALPKMTAEVGKREAEIAKLNAEIVALKGSLATARLTLAGAQETLRAVEKTVNVLPVDADPRIVALGASREVAVTVLRAAEKTLAAFPRIDGDFAGEVHLYLDRRGIRGDLRASFEGTELLDGKVELSGNPMACVEIPGLGAVCAPF